ncbi:TetR/AcrR family transcriptional regulator [Streptoalloteichus hindustanus]|uniref:Transcriptional regulator, TetR family n=1 Tax=Streptoalloteichus hindustanus TaxID=2017 RepID=A0A1M5CSA9_STRHI|nr:TetR/AcrR family transcriptional regulator [Streptoalloteichus hindustanus]SHF57623.1 transcriptional regulator, TetR family [Streptoalloteichus hindustanus]
MAVRRVTRPADRTEAIMRAALELAGEVGYARLSIEAVAARAGVGKHTVYRRWPSKGVLFLDSILTVNEPRLDYRDTGDIVADLREQMVAVVDLVGRPPWGPLYRAVLGEAQHSPEVAAALNERFVRAQAEKTTARLRAARDQGQLSPGFDLDLASELLVGPLYFRLLISEEPLTHNYIDRVLEALFAGMGPKA